MNEDEIKKARDSVIKKFGDGDVALDARLKNDTVLNGDHFTHDRMKTRFYCSAVSRDDDGNIISVTLVDSPDKLPKAKMRGAY